MSMLNIDPEKCKKDGICALECPRSIIVQPKDELPALVADGESLCILCGHCVAVCPYGALDHKTIPLEKCSPFQKDLELTEEQVEHFLRSRRSIRVYKDRPVENEILARAIDIAHYAPTGGNSQTVHWTVINGREKVENLVRSSVDWIRKFLEKHPDGGGNFYYPRAVAAWDEGVDIILRAAPVLVVGSAPKVANTAPQDVAIALSYLDLAALPLGLATCWAGILYGVMNAYPEIRDEMGLPKDHPHYYPMMVGYPKFKYHRFPTRKKPKVSWL